MAEEHLSESLTNGRRATACGRLRGRLIATRLGRLARTRVAADVVALLLLAAGLTVALAAVAAVAFWSGWVALLAAPPVGLLAWRWLGQDRFVPVVREVEAAFPLVRGRLRAAHELARYNEQSREGYSVELLDAAIEQVEAALRPLPLGRLEHRERPAWSGGVLAGAALLCTLLFAVMPARLRLGLANAFVPSRLDVSFVVAPGDTAVMPGASVSLRCRVEPTGVLGAVWMETREQGAEGRALGAERRRVRLAGDRCVVSVPAGRGVVYRFRALSAASASHRVRVLEPLALSRLEFTLRYPEYSGLPAVTSLSPDMAALRGTVVDIKGQADRLIGASRMVLGTETLPLSVDGRDSTRFAGRFTVQADVEGSIELAGPDDGGPRPAAVLRVHALADEPPFVRLFLPGRDVDLPVSMQVPLGVNAIDDFGLGELWLCHGTDSIDRRTRIKALAGRREDTTYYLWDLSEAGLLPGGAMRYFVSVTDNDRVSGPKTSRSETYSVRFPTMAELYSSAVRQTEQTTAELGPMQTQQEQLSADLSRIADDLKRNRELDWSERQALEQTLAGQQDLMRQAEELRAEVEQFREELGQGMNLDKETMNRLGQLQELLSEMLPRELQQSLAQLRDKLQQQSPDVRQALDKFQLDQEKLKAGIERALALLQRIAEEQRLEELARRAEELAQQQQQLTEKLATQPAEASAALQNQIREALDSLQQAMRALGDSMSDRQVGDSLGNLAAAMDRQQLSQLAQRLASQMQQGRAGESQPESNELGQMMERLAESLSALSKQLKQKRSDEVARRLAAAASDLLMVSEQQEQMEQHLAAQQDLAGQASSEMGLHDAAGVVAESLAALAGQSLQVPPGIGQELARVMASMSDAAQAMVENRSLAARPQMAGARLGLNRAAQSLMQAAADAQQGGGMSGGMDDLMEQLSKMASGQMGINSEMGGMPIPIPGGMSPSQMQALARILAKQQALRQQLQQMMDAMGGTQPGLTSSMEGVLDDMLRVERDLAELNVTRELVERQESILSHLLDAQRSIRQQGFKEERESESGKAFEIKERPRLPQDAGERNRLLREELMRALKQGYPAEYERMIRAYFDRLLNEQR